jgi:hypothetical protein
MRPQLLFLSQSVHALTRTARADRVMCEPDYVCLTRAAAIAKSGWRMVALSQPGQNRAGEDKEVSNREKAMPQDASPPPTG